LSISAIEPPPAPISIRSITGVRMGSPEPFVKRLTRAASISLATATVRIVPIAPFGVVNLVAGASHVRLRDFLVGTVLAMAPGTAVLVFASDRILRAVSAPDAGTIVTAIAAAAGAAAVVLALRRWGPFRSGDASA